MECATPNDTYRVADSPMVTKKTVPPKKGPPVERREHSSSQPFCLQDPTIFNRCELVGEFFTLPSTRVAKSSPAEVFNSGISRRHTLYSELLPVAPSQEREEEQTKNIKLKRNKNKNKEPLRINLRKIDITEMRIKSREEGGGAASEVRARAKRNTLMARGGREQLRRNNRLSARRSAVNNYNFSRWSG